MATSETDPTDRSGPVITVFGAVGVEVDGEPVSIGGPRQRRLLALLAIRAGRVVDIDWLAEHLWTDDDRPDETQRALRTYVSRLRQALPATAQEWVETAPGGYRLAPPAGAVETSRFVDLRRHATKARERDDPLTAQRFLAEALDLWRGAPFRELEDLDWARAEIEHLQLDRLEMLEERWEVELALGRHTQITGELAAFTAEHGLRDRAARQHALALHRSGRTPEALRVIDHHRRTVANETGLEPSPAIIELERALVAGDESLDLDTEGRPLRGYRLVEEAGAGAFAIVWRGYQPSVQREVAIKQIRSELASQPEFVRRFEAEAHLVARIEHPHIVPLIDYWRDPDSAYLVMRWLDGGTLERRLDDGPLSLGETLALARQVGGALSAAHARDIVHRDVKPGNILFDEAGNAFLGDFGIALEVAESAGPEAALSPGSPAYSAPEQIRRERLRPQADVFSLAVVIFECLTGSPPFGGGSPERLIERQLHEPHPRAVDLNPDVPQAVSDAIARATAKDPDDRFDSAAEFLEALEPSGRQRAARVIGSGNPYKGLRAFDDGDEELFFGRERLVNELSERLSGESLTSRAVILVGPSGSGKSSVVRAGLIPTVRTGRIPGSDRWFVTTMVPGSRPFEALEAALLRIAINPPTTLLDQLQDGGRGILRGARRCVPDEGDRILLVVDQLEELFTTAQPDEANEFLDALAVAVADPTSPLRLVATLRADYYDRPLSHPTFAALVKQAAVDVTPLAADELERVIVEPARSHGLEFDPGLVARIAAATVSQPAPLPLLQYTLSELFERRDGTVLTARAYDELGGLAGAVAERAEAIHDAATETQRSALRRVFGRLTNPVGESPDLRRRVAIADLGDEPESDWVLDQLGAARLLTFDRDIATREPTIEVAHEALLREWPRLVGWLRDDSETLRAAETIGLAASAWDAAGRSQADLYRGERLETAVALMTATPERLRAIDRSFIEASVEAEKAATALDQRRERRRRTLMVATAAALVVAVIAAAFAFRSQRQAEDQARIAEQEAAAALDATAEAELATLISRSAALAAEDPDSSILLALEAHRRSPSPETELAVLASLGSNRLPHRLSSLPPIFDPQADCQSGRASMFGTRDFSVSNEGRLISRDPLTGVVTDHGPSPSPCPRWAGDERGGFRAANTASGSRIFVGPWDGDWEARSFEDPTFVATGSFAGTDRVPVVTQHASGRDLYSLLDARTGETVGAPVSAGVVVVSDVATRDGTLFAVSFGELRADADNGITIILDGATGQEISRFSTPEPPVGLTFDETTGELIAVIPPQTIATIDVDTGGIIATVDAGTTAEFLDLGVRDDGLVLAVTAAEAQVVDRRRGPVAPATPLRDVLFAFVRDDGTLFAISAADERAGVIDLEGSLLVDRWFPTERFDSTTSNNGLLATVPAAGGTTAAVIDPATGEQTSTELVVDGRPFTAQAVHPEVDGLWAIDFDNVFTRWVDGALVHEFDLGGEAVTGTRFGDLHAHIWLDGAGALQAGLFDLSGHTVEHLFTVPGANARAAHPTLEGGMHVVAADGTLRTYDRAGELTDTVQSTATDTARLALDPSSGRLAVATSRGVVSLVDPVSGERERLPTVDVVANLGFARNGELLVLAGIDGTIRLWDVERRSSAGVVWEGAPSPSSSPLRYDDERGVVWVPAGERILEIPLEPAVWIERACEAVPGMLSQQDWDRLVPGGGEPRSGCDL